MIDSSLDQFTEGIDILIDRYVIDADDAVAAEKILQQRAQDMRERYATRDGGDNA